MSYSDQPPTPPNYGSSTSGTTPAATRPGELLDRFLARLVDGVLLAVVYFIVGVFLVGSVALSAVDSTYVLTLVTTLILVGLQLGYYVLMETRQGQTIGKLVMKLRVVGPQGGHPTVEQSFKRNAFMALGLVGIVPVIGLLGVLAQIAAVIMIAVTINSDAAQRQGWHDKFAGTYVLKEG